MSPTERPDESDRVDARPGNEAGPALVIGLTGGMGVGKSTVAAMLAERGAIVIDVDGLGREVLEPGGGAHAGVVATFGEHLLGPDGTIDRVALAREVFGEGRLADLEAISHPAIEDLLERRIAAAPAGAVVVLDMAVLVESRLGRMRGAPVYDRVVVVEAPLELRLERLAGRGVAPDDARARIAAQASDAERRAMADLILVNDGDLDTLHSTIATFDPTVAAWASQAPRGRRPAAVAPT